MEISLRMLAAWSRADRAGRTALDSVSEGQFQKAVIMEAKSQGWLEYHVDMTATRKISGGFRGLGPPGFPDLVMTRSGDLIFAELKSEKGPLSDAQKTWLGALGLTHNDTYIWRPRDASDIIARLA